MQYISLPYDPQNPRFIKYTCQKTGKILVGRWKISQQGKQITHDYDWTLDNEPIKFKCISCEKTGQVYILTGEILT
jgi:hypothetical protein